MILNNLKLEIVFNQQGLSIVIKPHEDSNNDGDEFMHACIIIVFLLIKFLYSLIHSINCLFQFIQFYSVLVNFINLTVMLSLTACCM